ncbi:MAG: IPT/TIG domain-containing protein [Prolixibacteraceae bacterium]|nr:IPT/TIG domain-containing protein [Prolixibacteraceae bacterium]
MNKNSSRIKSYGWLLPLMILAFIPSCNWFNFTSEGPSRNLLIDEIIEVASQTIPASGGLLEVNAPGSVIDGLRIEVKALPGDREFTVKEALIERHNLGNHFQPISPLIQIDNGGGYAAEPINITVPIQLPEGHFAMGFIYDETTGMLEGMPVLELTEHSITVQTRHFMSGSSLRNDWNLEKSAPVQNAAYLSMVIASVSESALKKKTVISSNFRIGTDDWEFINWGSYIAPGGHCAGQSMTAMWYYYEQKLNNQDPLFNRFNMLNKKKDPLWMWMDNPLGYRFASVIQNDFNFNGWISQLNFQSYLPSIVFKCFAASILVTGEPQFVLINNSQGEGGHAMIVTGVNYDEGILYIADPNYPNNYDFSGVESIRTIELVNDQFKAYETGLNAGAASTTMDQIGYFAKTTFIDWSQIGKRYNEVLNQTIGTIAPNNFPEYQIKVSAGGGKQIYEGFTINRDTLDCYATATIPEVFYNIQNEKRIGVKIYDDKGNLVSTQDRLRNVKVKLKKGKNLLGFYVFGWKIDFKEGERYLDQFIDFQWLNIIYSPLEIDPDPLIGNINKAYTLACKSNGEVPKRYKMVWDFGDGSPEVSIANDSMVTHSYQTEGNFITRVKLYDRDDIFMAEASARAIIEGTAVPLGDPVIHSISPDSSPADQFVTIYGDNFGKQQYEGGISLFYNEECEIASWTNQQIVMKIPLKAKNEIGITIKRKTPSDEYNQWSNTYKYQVYPEVLTTLKRVQKIAWVFSGNFINAEGKEREVQIHMSYFDPKYEQRFNGLSLDYTGSDTLDFTPGKEIFFNHDIHLTVSGDGSSLSGIIAFTGENRYVGPPTLYKEQRINISNMKLSMFNHDMVVYACTEEEAKGVIGSFLDNGGHGWDNYVDFKTASGSVRFYEITW